MFDSWASGANPWGQEKEDHFTKPTHYDGMLEIIAVTGVVHLGQIQSGLRGAIRIAQGGHVSSFILDRVAPHTCFGYIASCCFLASASGYVRLWPQCKIGFYSILTRQPALKPRGEFWFNPTNLNEGNISTVEPLTNDHPHQRPSLSYDHILCDGLCILFVFESLTSDHPSYTTTPM